MYIIVLIVIIRTLVDISFKAAVRHIDFDSVSTIRMNICLMAKNPFLWIGLVLGVINMLVWVFSLNQFDLSYAYPFLSVSYITVILCGKFIFKEHLDKNKIIGVLFIIFGAALLFAG
jgi:drug/metabolite transporter (DMT)-like permease